MKQVIITGATGPLGIALIKYLSGLNISLTAVARPGSRRNSDIPALKGVRVIECDLNNLGSLKKRLEPGYDTFFHLGWNTSSREIVKDPFIQAPCIVYTLDAVQLAHDLGCNTFIGAGSWAEYGRVEGLITADTPSNPETSYGIAKYAAGKLSRKMCKDLGIRHCWCRIFSMYGPFDRQTTAIMYCIYSLLQGNKPVLTDAQQDWDYIYSFDCAKALKLVAEKGKDGAVYPVGSGRTRLLREYFECIQRYIDPALPLGIGGKSYPDGQAMHLCADISVLTKDTGFIPEYPFEAGIKETIEWAKKELRHL